MGAVLHACAQAPARDAINGHLAVVYEAMCAILLGRLADSPIIGGGAAAADYLMLTMSHLSVEHVRVLFLNTRNRLIRDEIMMRGTIDEAPLFPREILKRALEIEASSLILAHNHPSGDPTPSKADLAATRRLINGGRELGLTVLDHLILSTTGWISLRILNPGEMFP